MTKLVLLLKAQSIYDDVPDEKYDFPAPYLKAVQEGVDDWAVYYEPVKAGPRGYFAVAKISRVIPKPVGLGQTSRQGGSTGVVADLASSHEEADRATIDIGDGMQSGVDPDHGGPLSKLSCNGADLVSHPRRVGP